MSGSGQPGTSLGGVGTASTSTQRRASDASGTAPHQASAAPASRSPKPSTTTPATTAPPASTSGEPSTEATTSAPSATSSGKAQHRQLPLPWLLGVAGCAGLAAGLVAALLTRRRRRRRGGRKGSAGGAAAAAKGPCSKLKPTAKCVPLADGSACVIRREIPADNSCLFNSIGYVMHKSKTRAPHLRTVVAQQVAGDNTTYSDAFLGMTNEAYCSWIRQPFNWGGGIELAILAQAYSMEIVAWNIESCKEHVFGEESGYKRQAMVIYNGVHYDALAVAAGPRANPDDDETTFNPRTKRGKMIIAAARKLTELAHKESAFHGAAKKQTATTTAQNGTAENAQNGTAAAADGSQGGAAKAARPAGVTRRVPRAAAAAGTSAAVAADGNSVASTNGGSSASAAAATKLCCGDCGELLCGSAAAAEHAKATGHQNYQEVAA